MKRFYAGIFIALLAAVVVPLSYAQNDGGGDSQLEAPAVIVDAGTDANESADFPPTQEALPEISEQPQDQSAADNASGASPSQADLPPEEIILDVLELKDMDINDVIKLISKKSGLNIVTGQNVRGKISIYLKNVNVKDALRIILESSDLAYSEEGNIIRVMTAKDFEMTYGKRFGDKTQVKMIQLKYANAAETAVLMNQFKSIIGKTISDDKSNTLVLMDIPEKLESMEAFLKEIDIPVATKVFDLSYAKAEDITKEVMNSLTKNVGTVKSDKRSNKIIVTDTPQRLDEIERMILVFDEKHEEVLIEAKIAQIVLSDQYKFGVDWEAIVSNYHALDLKGAMSVLSSTDKRGKISIGTIASDDYTVLIEALDTVGKTNILSSPHITTVNNQEAKILVGSTEPYVTTTTTTPASGPTTTAESVNFIDVGVKLYVTPMIHKDRNITMKIKPEVSSVTRFLTTGNNNKIPVVETSQAETTILVKDGVTIIIGGLIKDENVESINKVPLLGDLPIVGFAFRNKDKLTRKTELVIFLTPKIISGDVTQEQDAENAVNAAATF